MRATPWVLAVTIGAVACGVPREVVDAAADCTKAECGPSCTAGQVCTGSCAGEPRCVCVWPEGKWHCCFASSAYTDPDQPVTGRRCCFVGAYRGPFRRALPPSCACDDSHHWRGCEPLDLASPD